MTTNERVIGGHSWCLFQKQQLVAQVKERDDTIAQLEADVANWEEHFETTSRDFDIETKATIDIQRLRNKELEARVAAADKKFEELQELHRLQAISAKRQLEELAMVISKHGVTLPGDQTLPKYFQQTYNRLADDPTGASN
jgi:hypothetical protein